MLGKRDLGGAERGDHRFRGYNGNLFPLCIVTLPHHFEEGDRHLLVIGPGEDGEGPRGGERDPHPNRNSSPVNDGGALLQQILFVEAQIR